MSKMEQASIFMVHAVVGNQETFFFAPATSEVQSSMAHIIYAIRDTRAGRRVLMEMRGAGPGREPEERLDTPPKLGDAMPDRVRVKPPRLGLALDDPNPRLARLACLGDTGNEAAAAAVSS